MLQEGQIYFLSVFSYSVLSATPANNELLIFDRTSVTANLSTVAMLYAPMGHSESGDGTKQGVTSTTKKISGHFSKLAESSRVRLGRSEWRLFLRWFRASWR